LESRRTASAATACLLAWLLPGLGHLFLKRVGRGLIFLAALGTLFVLGVAMGARLQMYFGLDDPLSFLRSLSQMAIGLPYFLARGLGFEVGQPTAVTYEYGNTFTEVGGLLNVLVILDALDVALGRKP